MGLEPKEVTCNHCKNTITLEEEKDYCTKCGRKVFYHQKDQRRHLWTIRYIYAAIAMVLGFGVYLFIEMLKLMT